MTERDLIKEFYYNGCDISEYQNKIEVVGTNESKFISDANKTSIATTRTYSCTNILVFNKDFAYLAHMFPSETVGMNNDFNNRLNELEVFIKHFNPNVINVLICLGESVANPGKSDFHDLKYLKEKLNTFRKNCENINIEVNLLPVMKSKYLLFDLENYLLYIDNPNKEVIDVNELLPLSRNKKK